MDYSAITDDPDVEFAQRLVTEHGVAAIPVSPFTQATGPDATRAPVLLREARRDIGRARPSACCACSADAAWVLAAGLAGALSSNGGLAGIAAAAGSGTVLRRDARQRRAGAGGAEPLRLSRTANRTAPQPVWPHGSGGTWSTTSRPIADGGVERRLIERTARPSPTARRAPAPRTRRPRSSRSVEDVVSVLRFAIRHREVRDGRDVVAVGFEPKPGAEPQTRQGELARHFTGTIFVDGSRTRSDAGRGHGRRRPDLRDGAGGAAAEVARP
jgi:hypothetical protein